LIPNDLKAFENFINQNMKTKILTLIAIACIMATSFAFVSAKGKKAAENTSAAKIDEPAGGFIMEDRN
jgi:hypothetical protein